MFFYKQAGPFILTLTLVALGCCSASQAQNVATDSSLKFAPADVAFYVTSMRHREQYDTFVKSQAFAKIMEMPVVQMGLNQLKSQWENPEDPRVAQMKALLQFPENKQLVEVLKDGVSNEIFMYGDSGFAELIETFQEVNTAMNHAQFEAISSGRSPEEVIPEKLMEIVSKKLADFSVPDLVWGFKMTDTEAAKTQLARLEATINLVLAQQSPEIQERFSRQTVGDSEYLTVSLDGSLVPWDQLPLDNAPVDVDELEQIIDKLKAMTLSISLGVYNNYVLLSIGDNNDHLAALGNGELLVEQKELSPMQEKSSEPIVSVGYVSKEFLAGAASPDQQLNGLVDMARGLLPMAPIDEATKEEIIRDVSDVVEKIKDYVPEQGAMLDFTYLSPLGYEGYRYSWTQNPNVDSSQPLSILDHVGGDPILFIAGRSKSSPEGYDEFVQFIGKAFGHVESIMKDQMDEDDLQKFQTVRERVMPLLKRLDQANRTMLIPAMADGQGALVIDAKERSKQVHIQLPPSDDELPVPEIAFVQGVSDANLLRQGASEYLNVLKEAYDIAREMEPNGAPNFEISGPKQRKMPGGTIYYYPLPAEAGFPTKLVAPNAGLSDSVLVCSVIPKTTVRLLGSQSLNGVGPLANTDRPLAAAFRLDFAGLLDAARPWVDYVMEMQGMNLDDPQLKFIMDQVDTGIRVAKCLRGFNGVVYTDADAIVTHYVWQIEDL